MSKKITIYRVIRHFFFYRYLIMQNKSTANLTEILPKTYIPVQTLLHPYIY